MNEWPRRLHAGTHLLLFLGVMLGIAAGSSSLPAQELPADPCASPSCPPPDDGLTAAQRSVLFAPEGSSGKGESEELGFVIASRSKPYVFFGLYRASKMTGVGWGLFENSVRWLLAGNAPSVSRVHLFDIEGSSCAGGDGQAVFDHLVNSMGFQPTNIMVRESGMLPYIDLSGFDLVIYATGGAGSNVNNVLESGVPFLTFSSSQTLALGIGTGYLALNAIVDRVHVRDDPHPVTAGIPTGWNDFLPAMFMSATRAGGDGQLLVATTEAAP